MQCIASSVVICSRGNMFQQFTAQQMGRLQLSGIISQYKTAMVLPPYFKVAPIIYI
jgi:hypothetical protein